MFPPPAGIARPLNIRVNGWTGQTARVTSTLLEQSGEFSGAESARLGATASPPPIFSPLTTTGSEELSDSFADLGASCDQDDLASLVSSLSGMFSFSDSARPDDYLQYFIAQFRDEDNQWRRGRASSLRRCARTAPTETRSHGAMHSLTRYMLANNINQIRKTIQTQTRLDLN